MKSIDQLTLKFSSLIMQLHDVFVECVELIRELFIISHIGILVDVLQCITEIYQALPDVVYSILYQIITRRAVWKQRKL